ncbi:MAG: homoserine O-succinyltransferase [Pseudomonadota bacterium]
MLIINNLIEENNINYFNNRMHDLLKDYVELTYIHQPSQKLSSFDHIIDSHIILSGSEVSICDDIEWAKPLIELVQKAYEKNISTIGICYGHQLIAKAIQGPSSVRKAARAEFGWFPIKFHKQDSLFKNIDSEIKCMHCHFDEVTNLDERFEILAASENCSVQAFRIKNKPIWGTQFHPEIEVLEGYKIIDWFSSEYPKLDFNKDKAMQEAVDSDLANKIFNNFLD